METAVQDSHGTCHTVVLKDGCPTIRSSSSLLVYILMRTVKSDKGILLNRQLVGLDVAIELRPSCTAQLTPAWKSKNACCDHLVSSSGSSHLFSHFMYQKAERSPGTRLLLPIVAMYVWWVHAYIAIVSYPDPPPKKKGVSGIWVWGVWVRD